jgi:3-hydroxyanthranilate 3,4-dioxygenase
VIERKRGPLELDGFMWFCDHCNAKLYEEFVYINDIVGQLPPIFDRFYGSDHNRRCKQCGTMMPAPG